MKKYKSHFKFNKQERSGIFFLLLIILLLQLGFYYYKFVSDKKEEDESIFVNEELQHQINLLKQEKLKKDTLRIFPFNPNFISDYKGYTLGMSLEEIDRLHAFRAQNKYVNSDDEFQKVTLVSDSLLRKIAPYFKFPEWVNGSSNTKEVIKNKIEDYKEETIISLVKQDLNSATVSNLKSISGIGDKLSERIVKFRDKLGGFLVEDQLYDVYGLDPQVVEKALKKFTIIEKPSIQKINLNTCSLEELSKFLYFDYALSKKIIRYRDEKNGIESFDELMKIEGFPSEKINRISLYLAL